MAFGPGKAGHFALDDSGGTLRTLSTYIDSANLDNGQETYDVTTLGGAARAFIPGLTNATIKIGGAWDPTLDGYLWGNFGKASTSSFEIGPAGATPGSTTPVYKGEGIVTAYSGAVPVGDAVRWTASIQCSGTIDRDVT